MKLVQSLLDYTKPWSLPDVYLFTGNSYRSLSTRQAVMGRGAALAVKMAWPVVPVRISLDGHLNWLEVNPDQWIGWFKVKNHYNHPAQLDLIRTSTRKLARVASLRPNRNFHMNFPGVGAGKLNLDDVKPIVEELPDNVTLYL